MPETNQTPAATVPPQREASSPVKKSTPVVIALIAIVALIGIANVSSLVGGRKKAAPASALPMRPASANPQQVSSFETQQQIQAQRDADSKRQQEIAAEMQQLQAAENVPGPEAAGAPPMTAAQRSAIYGDSPNAPQQTSNVSQAQADAKQKALEGAKLHQDALNSDTVAIDFARPAAPTPATGAAQPPSDMLGEHDEVAQKVSTETPAPESGQGSKRQHDVQTATEQQPKPAAKTDPMAPYDFDTYQGHLYRVFEGTVL
jgi:type IV secretion system protein VirB10